MKKRLYHTMRPLFALLLALITVCTLSLPLAAAKTLETLDPSELFYITGAVSKDSISQGDADANGDYPLSYTATATLPDLLGKYITTYSKYVTDFSFSLNVMLTAGLEPDPASVSIECAFGELADITVANNMMYITVNLKSGTALKDYTYEQWTSPIYLKFDAVFSGATFSSGDQIAVSMDVSGQVSGSHPLLGELSVSINGTMDPNHPRIVTQMTGGSETHTAVEPQPPTPSPSKTMTVEIPNFVPDFILSGIPTVDPPHSSQQQGSSSAGNSSSSPGTSSSTTVTTPSSDSAAVWNQAIATMAHRILLIIVLIVLALLIVLILILVLVHRHKKKKSGGSR